MRKYLEAYLDIVGSGLINKDIVLNHIQQHATIDKILPDSASFFYIVESPSHRYHFMGKQQESVSGYSNEEFLEQGVELFLKCLHPDEIDIIVNQIYPDAMSLVLDAATEDKKKIQLQYNYRFKRKTGEYTNLMEQLYVLEVDTEGKASLLLGNIITLDNEMVLPMRLSGTLSRNNVSRTVFSKYYTNSETSIDNITTRELDILRNLSAGKTSKEIGRELYISPHTVDTHRRNLLKKLNCKSVVELARFAFRKGLL